VLFGDGEAAHVSVPADAAEPLEALLLAGPPLGEPVARHGPFVMNSRDELAQAVQDFQTGKMGSIAPAE
jgi:redox-sensitive bicupin YhaK (pirin superfamily)